VLAYRSWKDAPAGTGLKLYLESEIEELAVILNMNVN